MTPSIEYCGEREKYVYVYVRFKNVYIYINVKQKHSYEHLPKYWYREPIFAQSTLIMYNKAKRKCTVLLSPQHRAKFLNSSNGCENAITNVAKSYFQRDLIINYLLFGIKTNKQNGQFPQESL